MKVKKSVFDLQPGDVFGEDVFEPVRLRVLLVPKGWKIGDWEECEELKVKLQEFNVQEVIVDVTEDKAPVPPIGEIRKKALSLFPIISEETRKRALDVVKRVTEAGELDLKEVDELVDDMVNEVIAKGEVMLSLYAISRYDDYTFVHSVNVSILTALFALEFSFSRDELKAVTKGAILHDLGKLRVPKEILNKPGPLAPEEFEEIKKHPIYGVDIAISAGEKSDSVISVISQHHEWFSGRGYPRGLGGERISLLARIVSVVDVFDALTTDRVYKPRMLSYEAISKMLHEGAIHFDPKVLSRFISRFGIYPVGSLVRLSDGKIGVVLKSNPLSPIRPIIKVLYDEYSSEVEDPYEIDLSSSELFIKDVLADLSKSFTP